MRPDEPSPWHELRYDVLIHSPYRDDILSYDIDGEDTRLLRREFYASEADAIEAATAWTSGETGDKFADAAYAEAGVIYVPEGEPILYWDIETRSWMVRESEGEWVVDVYGTPSAATSS